MAAGPSDFKRPASVLVVVHTPGLDCLLLERVVPEGFWQSVTGTLRWGEPALDAAVREVAEETGLAATGLVDTGITRTFPILPAWRPRYAPDVTDNVEHLFYLSVEAVQPVELNPAEHSRYEWLPVADAAAKVASWTNRAALEALAEAAGR